MSYLTFIIFTLLSLVSIGGIFYPFPPFKNRAIAFASFLITLIIIVVTVTGPDFERQEQLFWEHLESTDDLEEASKDLTGIQKKASKDAAQIAAENETMSPLEKIQWLERAWNYTTEDTKSLAADEFESLVFSIVDPIPVSDKITNEEGYALLARIDPYSSEANPEYSTRNFKWAD